ncbi:MULTISPECIES: sugar kinase [unclassified Arthrobacter]|uniref:sugar kinase n=1 Tax=unclassified Arthrobacter TaxID=235627 RepID=UPI002E09E6F9|nr:MULTISPECIES: sugar kinase [unclassified Arthrobacter]MEC5189794.1 2-dehydro-3-deoxygluconokinase [Arthrobacter sp. MP_M4]MEC5201261.1 2-dehydro-3-deoxygluconokinase [Arthrobacter sp. MP_M7]
MSVDLLTLGESMVSLRSTGPLSAGGSLGMHVAGAESNVAVGVARLGHSVAWAGVLGADPHGEFILRQLRSEGIRIHHREDADRSTGVMFLEQRTADVSRAFYYRAGSAGSTLSRDDVDAAFRNGAKVLHLTGITAALGQDARRAVEYAAARAAGEGLEVSLDVNYRSKLWSRDEARAVLGPLARHASILVASDDELGLVAPGGTCAGTGGDAETAMAAELLGRGVREVVVKRGAAGAGVHTAGGRWETPAVPVTSIDTVGAGDAFTAGYLSALLDGEDVAGRLHRGALAGAFAVSTAGDWEGLPRRRELALLGTTPGGTTQR